jgi:hypothetical protein
MAKKQIRTSRTTQVKTQSVKWEFPLEKQNLIYFGIGLGVILLGYLLMATGITEDPATVSGKWNNPLAVIVAPVLLILGYCVIIPYSIIKSFRKKEVNQ